MRLLSAVFQTGGTAKILVFAKGATPGNAAIRRAERARPGARGKCRNVRSPHLQNEETPWYPKNESTVGTGRTSTG